MEKSPDAFRTISEVAEALATPTHVLRFWESRFPQIRPVKRAGGRRYYRPADVVLLSGIKRLLHEHGMTIRGVQKLLREQGVRHVASLADPSVAFSAWQESEELPPSTAESGTAAQTVAPVTAAPENETPTADVPPDVPVAADDPANVIAFPIEASLPQDQTDPIPEPRDGAAPAAVLPPEQVPEAPHTFVDAPESLTEAVQVEAAQIEAVQVEVATEAGGEASNAGAESPAELAGASNQPPEEAAEEQAAAETVAAAAAATEGPAPESPSRPVAYRLLALAARGKTLKGEDLPALAARAMALRERLEARL